MWTHDTESAFELIDRVCEKLSSNGIVYSRKTCVSMLRTARRLLMESFVESKEENCEG